MNSNALLYMIFRAAGIPFKIDGKADRLTLQKAIYLIQAAGLNLGYSHSWYKMGPYSPDLTKDYYAISEELSKVKGIADKWVLSPSALAAIEKAKALFQAVPRGVDKTDWLEALASVHYVDKNLPENLAQQRLAAQKSHLANVIPTVREVLKSQGFN